MTVWRTLLFLSAAWVWLCAGVAAGGTTRPGIGLDHRIGQVSWRESKSEVTKTLGAGVITRLDGQRFTFYSKAGIYVGYARAGRVQHAAVFIMTRSARFKTRSGAGVGSSIGQLRHQVKVRCYDGTPVSPPDVCQHERANINLPFTVFQINRTTGRVTQIAIVPGGD